MSRKKKSHRAKRRLEALKQKLEAEGLTTGQKVIIENSSGEKMSEVLLAFIEPYSEFATTREEFDRLVGTAAFAWNVALFPEKTRNKFLAKTSENFLKSGGKGVAEDFKAIVLELIARKERLFPDNKRFIVSFEVSETQREYHLSVASTLGA